MKNKQLLFLCGTVITLGVIVFGVTAATANTEPAQVVLEPFYGVAPELEPELEQIALSDAHIQELIEEKEYTFIVDGQEITDTDYCLAVGVYLKDDITPDQFSAWIKSGRFDSPIIKEYVGVLNIGYNTVYRFNFNKDKSGIENMSQVETGKATIPEVTAQEKTLALEIAFADPLVKQVLEGKKYQIAPEGKIGVWHDGDTKLGVSFQIDFDKAYSIDVKLPKYQGESTSITGEINGVIIDVLLDEGRIANIIPRSPVTEDLK